MLDIAIQSQFENLIFTKRAKTIYFGERFCVKKFIEKRFLADDFAKKIKDAGLKAFLVVPGMATDSEFKRISDAVSPLLGLIDGIISTDYGVCRYFMEDCQVIYEGEVYNSLFLEQLKSGLKLRKVRISPPYLNLIRKINKLGMEIEIYGHGLIPAASFANCLIQELFSCRECSRSLSIENLYGKFILHGKALFSSVDLSCLRLIKRIESYGISSIVIETFGKNTAEVEKLIDFYANEKKLPIEEKKWANGIFLGNDISVQMSGIWQENYADIVKKVERG